MPGLLAIFEKELADHLGSKRFIILFALICLAGLTSTWVAGQAIRGTVGSATDTRFVFLALFTASQDPLPSFVYFVSFLGPLAGLALGFDAVNSERASGTLSRVLSQPVHRDSFINGKFLAGLSTVSLMIACIMLILGGLGLFLIGVPPTTEEIVRLIAFFIITVVYVAFWMALSVLLSTVFRQAATSALAGIAIWILMAVFVGMLAGMIANGIAGDDIIANYEIQQAISSLSPTYLYQMATSAVLMPDLRSLGLGQLILQATDPYHTLASALPVTESLLVAWPQIVGLIALTVICFGVAYYVFMREEIRA